MQGNYIKCVAGILIVTAIGKIGALVTGADVMLLRDHVTGLDYRTLFVVIGLLEMVGACVLLRNPMARSSLVATLTFGLVFLGYRVASAWVGGEDRCPCLGALTGLLPIEERTAENLLLLTTVVMVVPAAMMLGRGNRATT